VLGSEANQYLWIGSLIGGTAGTIAIWTNLIKPWLRKRTLKHPVKAHFTIRNSLQSVSGRDVSQGDPHLIKRLVLPSNQTVEIELGLLPRIPIHISELVIGCEGEAADAPKVLMRQYQYVRSGPSPPVDKDYTAGNSYHARVDRKYNVGTHYVTGFKVQTQKAGLYPVKLSFITDEIEGNYDELEFLVEDAPTTKMRCHKKTHGRNCLVLAAE
jgi:hypothetical protein